jgi:hypothetical protein
MDGDRLVLAAPRPFGHDGSLASTEILRRRLDAQSISSTTFTRPEQVVAWLGAVQAQDYLGSLWAVGSRLLAAREHDVERALAERTIVRTWPMRGTLHLVAAADARWMTELLAQRPAAAAANRLRSAGIDEAVLARARKVLVKNLDGGRRLPRPAAYRVLERAKIATAGSRGIYVLWRLAHEGLICFGPREGKQQTFVLFEEWLPDAKRLPREEALATLAQRYFGGHGPATIGDFAWWSGLPLAEARLATALAGEWIEEEVIRGQPYWFAPSASSASDSRGGAHVLPAFDELLVGYADRSAALDARHVGAVLAGGIFNPIVVLDGRVVGTWKRQLGRREVVCSVAPFTALTASKVRAVERALGRYAAFVGLDFRRSSLR